MGKSRVANQSEGHDEPIVVENGPVSILMGLEHSPVEETGSAGRGWSREFTALNHVVIQQLNANGTVHFIKVHGLQSESQLELELENGEMIAFLVEAPGTIKLSGPITWTRDGQTGRLSQNNPNLRVHRVRGTDESGNSINEVFQINHSMHVNVVIIGDPA